MSHDTIAILFFFGGILTLIAVEIVGDVILAKAWGIDATISRSMHRTRRIVVFAFGALYGFAGGFLSAHFWWGTGSPEVDRPVVIARSYAQPRSSGGFADRFTPAISRRIIPRYTISEICGALGVLEKYASDDEAQVDWSYSLRVKGVPGPNAMHRADAAKLKRWGWYWDVNYRDWSLDRLDWMTKPGDRDDWSSGEIVRDYQKEHDEAQAEDLGGLNPEDLEPNGWSMGSL